MTSRVPLMMIVSIVFGAIAVVVGLTISFHAGTAGGATIAGLSVAQFFVVLVGVETTRWMRERRHARLA